MHVCRLAFAATVAFFLFRGAAAARTVVLWQPGFPTVSSQPVPREALTRGLGAGVAFEDVAQMGETNALAGTDLLVLPYGSAFPVDCWKNVHAYIQAGGNVLVLGGQPLRVPVRASGSAFFILTKRLKPVPPVLRGRKATVFCRILNWRPNEFLF